jgi:peroxiredoxin
VALILSESITTTVVRLNVIRYSELVIIVVFMVIPAFVHAGQFPESAPSFTLTDLNGKSVSLAEFRDDIVFLVFWASWCSPCREELPELDLIYSKFKQESFEVIAVSVDVSDKAVVNFLHKFPVSFTVLLDKQGDVNDAYRISGLPTSFAIGRKGIIRHVHFGFSKELLPMYEKEIADLIKQK